MTQNSQIDKNIIDKDLNEQKAIEKQRRRRKIKKRREIFLSWLTFIIIGFFALVFLMPTVLTITNSFMSTTEISANYGQIFSNATSDSKTFISEKVNLKFIPDMVSFGQYKTAFITSPAYLLKFWNSVILTVPIVIGQIIVAAGASYCFARNRSKLSNAIFFIYIILMLMPYQVTLVPNYLVAEWLHLLDTRWSIILPGIFAPFAVFILAKFMRRIPTAVVAVGVWVVLCAFGMFSTADFNSGKMMWSVWAMVAAVLGVVDLMSDTGLSAWIGDLVAPAVEVFASSPALVVIACSVLSTLLMMALVNYLVFAALAIALLAAVPMDPLCILFPICMSGMVFILPPQNVPMLAAEGLSAGRMLFKDTRPAAYAYVVCCLVGCIASIPWWSMLGYIY